MLYFDFMIALSVGDAKVTENHWYITDHLHKSYWNGIYLFFVGFWISKTYETILLTISCAYDFWTCKANEDADDYDVESKEGEEKRPTII